jgi:long-chain acyl-CoA synthetase
MIEKPSTMLQEDSHIFKRFLSSASQFSTKKAVIYNENNSYTYLTYSQLYTMTTKLGNILKDMGIRPDDKISVLLANQPEYPIAFFATMYSGAIFVPLDIQLPAEQIQQFIQHSNSRLLITTEKNYDNIKTCLKENNIEIVILDSPQSKKQLTEYKSDSRFNGEKSQEDLAILFYTSGTTDLPKAVMLTHQNLLANFNSICKTNILKTDDIIISVLPLHHAYPFTVTMLTPLLNGATVVYPSGLTSSELAKCLKETKATILVGVPQLYSLIQHSIEEKLKKLPFYKQMSVNALGNFFHWWHKVSNLNLARFVFSDIHKAFGGNLRFMISGGARLDTNIALSFLKWGFTILEVY